MNSDAQQSLEKRKRCPACKTEFTGTLVVCKHDGTLLIPVRQDNLIGAVLADKYRIESEVGRGGMSVVYRGRHELMDRTVAIKMLQAALVSDQTNIKRFQQEAKAASCLTHPNVITVYDYGMSPAGQPYLVMDFLEGDSLADFIRRDNHVAVQRALHIFIQASDALEHAHQKGVLHRDLKSSNIMLIDFEGQTDVVKVVDFGIAKLMPNSGKQSQNLTQTGEIFGSPIYMSPEQCLGQPLDNRSDIYSMGAMLYETLTGQPPLMGDTIIDTMQMHVSTQPVGFGDIRPDLYIPPAVEGIVFKALEKRPEDRYHSMQEFRDALVHVARQVEMESLSFSPVNAAPKNPRSTKQSLTASNRGMSTGSAKPINPQRTTNNISKPAMSSTVGVTKAIQTSTPMGSVNRASQYGLKSPTAANEKMRSTSANKAALADAEEDGAKKRKMFLLIGAGVCVLIALILIVLMVIKMTSQ